MSCSEGDWTATSVVGEAVVVVDSDERARFGTLGGFAGRVPISDLAEP